MEVEPLSCGWARNQETTRLVNPKRKDLSEEVFTFHVVITSRLDVRIQLPISIWHSMRGGRAS